VVIGANAPVDPSHTVEIPANSPSNLGGWIALPSGPPTAICAIVDGKILAGSATIGVARPDVATALRQADDAASGFAMPLALAPGPHAVTVGAVEADGVTVSQMNGPVVHVLVH
jgi:hypothetical protein